MKKNSVVETVASFVEAMNRGDLESALRHNSDDAVFISAPGTMVTGREAIRGALGMMMAAKPRITTQIQDVLTSGDVALYHSRWTMRGKTPEGKVFDESGESADVLRLGPDGRWQIVIDNPWGTSILKGFAGK